MEQSSIVFQPRAHFPFQQVFANLLRYRQYQKEYPAINLLDAQKGQCSQPIALNIVSNKASWHLPLKANPAKGIIGTILDN